jgi:Na+/melibiose symporter-like transporter
LGLWIGLPLAPWITRRFDKKHALVIPAVIVVVNANFALVLRLLDVSWFPGNESPWIFWIYFARYLLQGICLPVIFATFNSMFADIADEVELETRQRKEGVIYSSRSFATKFTSAAGAFVGGVALDLLAFPQNAVVGSVPADTLWWLGFVEGPATSLLSLCGVLFYLRYRINDRRHAEIRAAIDSRETIGSEKVAAG